MNGTTPFEQTKNGTTTFEQTKNGTTPFEQATIAKTLFMSILHPPKGPILEDQKTKD